MACVHGRMFSGHDAVRAHDGTFARAFVRMQRARECTVQARVCFPVMLALEAVSVWLISISGLERPQFVVHRMSVSGDRAVVIPRRSVPL